MLNINQTYFTEQEKADYEALLNKWQQAQTDFKDHVLGKKDNEEQNILRLLDNLDREIHGYYELSIQRYADNCDQRAEEQQRTFTDIVLDDIADIVRAISKEKYLHDVEKNEGRLGLLLYQKYYFNNGEEQPKNSKEQAIKQKEETEKIEEVLQTIKEGSVEGFIEYINLTMKWDDQLLALLTKDAWDNATGEAVDSLILNWAKENYVDDGEQLTIHLEATNKNRKKVTNLPAIAISPKDYLRPTSLIANSLKDLEGNTKYALTTLPKKKVETVVTLDYSHLKEGGVQGIEHLTADDEAILNAIISLYEANPGKLITAGTVYKTSVGDFKKNAKAEQLADIENSIEKMRWTEITIDGTAEAKARGYEDINSLKYSGKFLEMRKIDVEYMRNGKPIKYTGYLPLSMPIVMQYSQSINQVSRVPLAVLNTPVDNSKKTIRLRLYLMKQIDAMHKGSHRGNSILFETLYKEMEAVTDKQKDSVRRTTIKMLDYWKGKELNEKYITDYKCNKHGKTYYNIEINK